MAKIQLTDDQRLAVEDRGGSLLVSAAAGSGKTKVLVERLFSYMERERCHVDDFLIITYTRAAAAELRSRIAAELSRRVAEDPGNTHLRRQLFRVYQADIKTVDAFCASVLRENIHLLAGDGKSSLTPDFRVLDEPESLLLKRRVLADVLEKFYVFLENEDEEALLLAETLGAGRDDRALEALVLEVHAKIQSHVHPLQWLDEARKSWENLPQKLADSPYGRAVMEDTVRRAEFWAAQLEKSMEDLRQCLPVYQAYADRFAEMASQLRGYAVAAEEGWQAMSCVKPAFRRVGTVRGEENAFWKDRAKALRDQCKKEVDKLAAVYERSEEEHLEDLRQMAPAMLGLIRLTAEFTRAYQKEKLRRNVMDFSDQEHYAIEILTDPCGRPTPLARQISGRYREIMVDEYQDTNEVQNSIFRAISREEQNLFTVGDVKQSIYRFRLADPTIFLRKYVAYMPACEAQDGQPRKVVLSRNFRSRRTVLDCANFVFANIMSQQMGEMAYGEEEKLYFGAEYYPAAEHEQTEFHLINVSDTEDEQFDREATEARFVARRIRRLLDEQFPVMGENGTMRPVRPEDIAILMRSPRARQKSFTQALAKENILCSASEGENPFSTMEIAVIFSLLQIIDNPLQDVPLISVLRSPLFSFSPDRLAQIRMVRPEGAFAEALRADPSEDARRFIAALDELRLLSRELPVDRLVWEIYSRLHVPAVFGAMHGGRKRRENLDAFYAYAGQMAGMGKKSVFDFVTHLRRLLENDKPPLLHTSSSAGGVQLMSIHKSKGLEFPVVILADMNRRFNTADLNKPVLVHPQMGLGTERVDLQRRIRYDTLSKSALQLQLQRESKAEEMRVLYVAMTRAKEKLIVVDCMKRGEKRIRDLIALADLPVPPEAVRGVNCPGEWLLLTLLATEQGSAIHHWAASRPHVLHCAIGNWQVSFWENPDVEAEETPLPEKKAVSAAVLPDVALWESAYPYQSVTAAPTKVTATQLKGRELDDEIAEGTVAGRMNLVSLDVPRFLQEDVGLNAAERGTAMHLAMQYLPFTTSADPEAVAGVMEELRQKRLLTPQQAEAVDCRKLADFLASPLAERIRAAQKVWREYRFHLLVSAAWVDPRLAPEEEVMLQGVVDCCFETEEGLVVVDFKTDRIRPGQEAERAETYRAQLEAYAHALSQVLEKPVSHKILYFFATNNEISLK